MRIVCSMGILTKSIQLKSVFFGRQKKLKFGRRCPEPAGMVLNPFWTPQQKHLTPFHKKNYAPFIDFGKNIANQKGGVISGQHGIEFRCL